MKVDRLLLLCALGLGLGLGPKIGLATTTAKVQAWPTQPLKVVVPIGAGSVIDTVPRIVLERVSAQLGQSIIVENRPGAGMTIGTDFVARAEPDGYTALATSSAHAIAPALYPNLNYQPAHSFAAVAPLGTSPFVLVVAPTADFKKVRDLVSAGMAKPGTFNFASPGVGTASHLSAERFLASTGLKATHIPFKGGAEAITEVIAGRIDFFFVALGAALPHVSSGKLRALAVNGATRSTALPEVPTIEEAGFSNAEYSTWFGLFLPANTPREIVQRLHLETIKALSEKTVQDRLVKLGVEPLVMTPADFDAYVKREIATNAALVRAIGLKPSER